MKIKLKSILFLLLMFLLIFTNQSFASEEPTKHTIRLEIPANEELIVPYIWGNGSYSPVYSSAKTASFTVPDNNFAFETNATDINGNKCSAEYTTHLVYSSTGASKASLLHTADGSTAKLDWISTDPDSNYHFVIVNHSAITLAVYIEYYSWN